MSGLQRGIIASWVERTHLMQKNLSKLVLRITAHCLWEGLVEASHLFLRE